MYTYYFILLKLLRPNCNTLKSIVNLSIITSTFISVLLIPLSLSVINGFEENITSKIVSFDGYARVYLDELTSEQHNAIESIPSTVKFHEEEGLIKTNEGAEAVTIISYFPLDHHNLQNFLLSDMKYTNRSTDGVFIGKSLYDKLFIANSDVLDRQVILINTNNVIKNIEVLGVFQTYVPLYDQHFVLSTIYGSSTTGFIADQDTYNLLNPNLKSFSYTYNERYDGFLKWLNSYDLPIFILLSSIILIAIINNMFCFNMDLANRKNDSHIFNFLGLSFKQIHLIYFYKYLLLNLVGIILGSITAILLIQVQLNYNLIKIPEGIYFSSSIPLSLKIEYFLYVPLIFIFQSLCIFLKNRNSFNAI